MINNKYYYFHTVVVSNSADLKLEQDEEAKIRLLREGNLSGPMDKHILKVSKESMVRSHFVKWVVINRLPFNVGESEHFRNFCNSLNHSIEFKVSGEYVRNEAVKKAAEIRPIVSSMLKNQKVAITTDCWTSVANQSYISLTATYIDLEWNLVNLNLECSPFPGSHSANLLVPKIYDLLNMHSINRSDVCCCVTDNEPTNNAAADLMTFPWLGCVDHLLESS